MKFVLSNINEVTWFNRRNDDDWADETKCVQETIRKLMDAGKWEEFLGDESYNGSDMRYVDMDEIWDRLRLESDEVLAKYIGNEEEEEGEDADGED